MKEFIEYLENDEAHFIDVDSIKEIKVFKDDDTNGDTKVLTIAYGDGNESLEIQESKNKKEFDDVLSQVEALRPDHCCKVGARAHKAVVAKK